MKLTFSTRLLALAVACGLGVSISSGQAPTVKRSEALEIARSYAEHRWQATAANVRHGFDSSKVDVETPDVGPNGGGSGLWAPGQENTGMPYKWGGFDTLASFEKGVKAGKAAGDLYSSEKRRLGGKAVSGDAVGIDCSGFVSRCWKLREKYGTSTLPSICTTLRSPAELLAGDIMNTEGGHVILFAEWIDEAKSRARFFEANPYSKVIASEYVIAELITDGYQPLRYRHIQD